VIQALFEALISMDAAKLDALEAAGEGVTATERRRAEELFASAMLADHNHQDRRAQMWNVLVARQWESPPSLQDLFDDLTQDRAVMLGEFYDVLPEAARAEYDRRYGRPEIAQGTVSGPSWMEEAVSRAWSGARNLADLGELTAQYLEGRLSQSPTEMAAPAAETTELISLLTRVNRAGFVTRQSQPGRADAGDGRQQRASVSGFADDEGFARLMTAAAEASLIVTAARAGETDTGLTGGARSCQSLQADYGQACHPDAVTAICRAWQVTLTDSQRGRNDQLWPVLERFADS